GFGFAGGERVRNCCPQAAGAQVSASAVSTLRVRPLIILRASLAVAARGIVWCFLRNENVMGMALLYGRAAHQNETGPRAQFLDIPGSTIAHAGPQAADQLIHERREIALVRHAPF